MCNSQCVMDLFLIKTKEYEIFLHTFVLVHTMVSIVLSQYNQYLMSIVTTNTQQDKYKTKTVITLNYLHKTNSQKKMLKN